ncbi:hypothetical protein [Natronobacterium texcoconense]|uniref:Uncharacterized protein n=1 Tax=Natronobacterium texcoconense TaxID=1095778 RepID=A0A1H1AW81_NATTX|nr:hypothetical protein [Natronobacterium texcoconense]SDQ43912.1 hypothetical protein SAMN04489842_0832 [Natronobacterium texcoconense]
MSDSTSPNTNGSPAASTVSYPRRLLRQAWRDTLSIYYANTPIWRVLKSGGLLVFGLFCWSAASLLLSYVPEWTFLHYVMAYGFVLIFWGPLTHFVIVPLAIRLRRTAEHPVARTFARQASKINLSTFLLIVLVLGTAPISPMMLDFGAPLSDDSSPDVDTDLVCSEGEEVITCHLTDPAGVDHAVVTSGENELKVVDDPESEFEIRIDDLEEVRDWKEFNVELKDENGDRLGVIREIVH